MRTLRDIEQQLDQPVKTQLTEQHLALIAEMQEFRHRLALGLVEDAPFTRRQRQIQEMLKAAQSSQE